MQFDHLLTRAGDATLQGLIGRPALRLPSPPRPQPPAAAAAAQPRSRAAWPQPPPLDAEARRRLLASSVQKRPSNSRLCKASAMDSERPSATFDALHDINIRRNSNVRSLLDFFLLDQPDLTPLPTPPAYSEAQATYPLFPTSAGLHADESGARASSQARPAPHAYRRWQNAHYNERDAEHLRATEPGLVVWLAYSEELCEQAAQEFERAWSHLDIRLFRCTAFGVQQPPGW